MRPGKPAIIPLVIFIVGLIVLPRHLLSSSSASPPSPTNRPALYEFGAGFCTSCHIMAEVMAELKLTHGEQVEFRMVYLDQDKPLFQKYKIMLIPTQVFLTADGQEVHRHIGPLTKEQVLAKLKELKFIH